MHGTWRTRGTAVLIALAVVTTACSGDDDDTTETTEAGVDGETESTEPTESTEAPELTGEGLTIGLIRPPIGLFDQLGNAQADAVALAAEDIAAAGGVLDGPLTVVEDTPTTDRPVDVVFEDLVADDVRNIVGPTSSDEVRSLLPLLVTSDALVCGASTTGNDLTADPAAEGRFTRTVLDDNIVALNTARVVRDRTAYILDRPVRVTIVAREDSYGDSISGALAGLLTLSGFEVSVEGYPPEDVALTGVGDAVAATNPDEVVLIALEEGPRLTDLVVRAGVPPTSILGLDGLGTPRFAEQANAADPASLDGVTVIGSTGGAAFLQRLVEVNSGQVLYGAQAYDCAISLALAAEATGSTEPAELSAALREVTGGGDVCSTYDDCKNRLAAGEDIDYDGPSGPIGIDEAGDPSGGRFVTAVVTEGQLRVVSDLVIDLEQLRLQAAPRIAGFIAAVQSALQQLGYYDGPIDGKESPELTEAIKAFQTDQGLPATGTLDLATIQALQTAVGEDNAALAANIVELQILLTDLGYYSGPIDGIWSQAVTDAVKALQADLGVPQTGVIDAATLQAIYAAGLAAGTPAPTEPTPTTTTTAPATTQPPTTEPATTPPTTEPPATQPPTTVPVPADSILGVLMANPQFSTFVTLLDSPALASVKAALSDPAAVLTVFAPTNDALDPLPSPLPSDAELLRIVQYHALGQALDAAALIAAAPNDYPTLLTGTTVDVTTDGTNVTLNSASNVVAALADLASAAGFVHGIDTLLTPPPS